MTTHWLSRDNLVQRCAPALLGVLALAGCNAAGDDTAAKTAEASIAAMSTTDAPAAAPTSASEAPSAVDNSQSAATSTAPSPAGADGSPICALLEGVDFAAVIGEPVQPAAPKPGDENVCLVEASAPESTAQVSLSLFTSNAAQRFAESEAMFGADSRVAGFGDDAFHSGPVLAVLDGDRMYLLWLLGDAGGDISDSELEAVMTQILAAAD